MARAATSLRAAVLFHVGVLGWARHLPKHQRLSLLSSRRGAWQAEDHFDSRDHLPQPDDEPFDPDSAPVRELIFVEMLKNYSGRPSEDRWRELLGKATSTPEDPCNADILSTYGWNAGFGSGVNILMAEVAVAAYFGRTVAICHSAAFEVTSFQNLWQHPVRFCNRSELCSDSRQYAWNEGERRTPWGLSAMFWAGCLNSLECDLNPDTKSPWIPPPKRHPGITPELRDWSRRFRHFIYDSVFRFTAEQQKRVDEWVKEFGPLPEQQYVGVHLRGADKFQEAPAVNVSNYAEKILLALDRTKLDAVYLASDDFDFSMALAREMKAVAPRLTVLQKPIFEYAWGIVRRGGHNLDEHERTCLLGELQLLRKAAAFVGTASSNIGRMLYFLRTPQADDALDISVDEGGDWFSRPC